MAFFWPSRVVLFALETRPTEQSTSHQSYHHKRRHASSFHKRLLAAVVASQVAECLCAVEVVLLVAGAELGQDFQHSCVHLTSRARANAIVSVRCGRATPMLTQWSRRSHSRDCRETITQSQSDRRESLHWRRWSLLCVARTERSLLDTHIQVSSEGYHFLVLEWSSLMIHDLW